jgi:hypothetical protein
VTKATSYREKHERAEQAAEEWMVGLSEGEKEKERALATGEKGDLQKAPEELT